MNKPITLDNVFPSGNQHHLTIVRDDGIVEKRNWWNVNKDNPIILNDGDSLLGDDELVDDWFISNTGQILIQHVEIVFDSDLDNTSSIDDFMNMLGRGIG